MNVISIGCEITLCGLKSNVSAHRLVENCDTPFYLLTCLLIAVGTSCCFRGVCSLVVTLM